jgi:chemotaxis-related protein WspB
MLVLTFLVGTERLALDTRRIEAVVPRVPLRTIAGCAAWLVGVFVYHGRIVPVLDLHRLVGAGECVGHLSSRIILVREQNRLIGLLAAQVDDLQELSGAGPTSLTAPDQPDLGTMVAEGKTILRLLDFERLLPEAARRQVAALESSA